MYYSLFSLKNTHTQQAALYATPPLPPSVTFRRLGPLGDEAEKIIAL